MADYWEKYYARSLARKGKLSSEDCYCSPEQLKEFLLVQRLPLEGDVLVVGTGTSDLPALLAEGARVTGMDASRTAIDWMSRVQPEVQWHHGDAASMPNAWRNSFDCLIDKGLLAHIASDELLGHNQPSACSALLSEYRRVLRPGAYAVVASLSRLDRLGLSDGWQCEEYQLGETLLYVLRVRDLPGWVCGISRSSSKLLLRTVLSTAQTANVDLQVSDDVARVVLMEERDHEERGSGSENEGEAEASEASFERSSQVFEVSLPSRPLKARWTDQGLQLILAQKRQPCFPGSDGLRQY